MMSILEAISPTARELLADQTPVTISRTNVLALLDHEERTMRAALMGGEIKPLDVKLEILTCIIGDLASTLCSENSTLRRLQVVFGFTAGWLMQLGIKNVQDVINAERDRQDALFVEGHHLFSVASRIPDARRKLRVLVEEVGEVAQEIDQLESFNAIENKCRHWRKGVLVRELRLKSEIVQVSAVAVAWLESLQTATKEEK